MCRRLASSMGVRTCTVVIPRASLPPRMDLTVCSCEYFIAKTAVENMKPPPIAVISPCSISMRTMAQGTKYSILVMWL